jgi:hypothetical protein
MSVAPKLFAVIVLFLGAVVHAQTAPYAGAGIGVNGLGFQSPYYNADVGIDWGDLRPTFLEAEFGADTANPTGINNGTTIRGHGVVMWQTSPHWRLGGGIHFSELYTSIYDKQSIWPTLGAMFEKNWFRMNAQFLIPPSPNQLVGPLFDMRVHLRRNFFFRERVGIYWYVGSTDPSLMRARLQTSGYCMFLAGAAGAASNALLYQNNEQSSRATRGIWVSAGTGKDPDSSLRSE